MEKTKSKCIKGIGITREHIKRDNLKEVCSKHGYEIFYWTLKDDEKEKDKEKISNYNALYQELKNYGVTGFIT